MKFFIKKTVILLSLLMLMVVSVSCAPNDIESAKTKLKDAGYVVTNQVFDEDNEDGVTGILSATKASVSLEGIEYEQIIVVYFDSSSNAKKYADEWKDSKFTVKHSGKCAYAGTKQAIKDFTK